MTATNLRARRWVITALLQAVAVVGLAGLVPAPAAATAYRYWTYWTSPGSSWTFSQVGPASTVPKHGAVEGWRFAVSTERRGQGAEPRISPAQAFQQFCGEEAAPAGDKRVAVVFDFGTASDAPDGQSPPQSRGTCVEIDKRATGGEILARSADVRVEGGLVCAIGGYPEGECAPAVTPTPKPSRPRPDRDPRPAEPDPDPDPPTRAPRTTDDGSGGPAGAAPESPTPTPTPTPKKAKPSPVASATPTPVVPPSAAATSAPEFVAADAHTPADEGGRWGLLAAALALAGLGLFALLRYRRR